MLVQQVPAEIIEVRGGIGAIDRQRKILATFGRAIVTEGFAGLKFAALDLSWFIHDVKLKEALDSNYGKSLRFSALVFTRRRDFRTEGRFFVNLAIETIKLLAILLAPFALFAIVIHLLEQLIQRRLAERFGWNSVLWTGWLGTPIHELSHALMCRVFHHRIDEIALFEPDQRSGRLGFVRHSFKSGNWYQELGNFFIGIAPLMGGSVVLVVLLWLFFPGAIEGAFAASKEAKVDGPLEQLVAIVSSVSEEIFAAKNLATGRFWLFVYFVLCVGGHMAPSPSDYEGASRGVYLVGGGLLLFTVGLAATGTDSRSMVEGMIGILGPLFAILAITIVLCALATGFVWIVTAAFPQRFTTRR